MRGFKGGLDPHIQRIVRNEPAPLQAIPQFPQKAQLPSDRALQDLEVLAREVHTL